MDRDTIIRLAREAGAVFSADGSWHKFETQKTLERFAELVAEHKEKEMQERIDALFALYEQACLQRDQLMDMQRAQIAAMRGKTQ